MDEKKKILIVEDERSLSDVLSAKLSVEGFAVRCAYDGEQGMAEIHTDKPDLILMDIVMPKMDGYEMLEAMKSENINIPVIVISNSGQLVEIEKTKSLGAIDHLIKTQFSPIDVIAKVKDVFSGAVAAGNSEVKKVLKPNANPDVLQKGVKVLLVEDDSFLREICTKKLVKEGYEVYQAVDGEQAVYGAKEIKPDIVLLDIILPAVDGFQILGQIRAADDEKVAKVPIIMLSNLGQDDDIKKAMDMGANDYLVKAHFTTEEIVIKIKSVLGK